VSDVEAIIALRAALLADNPTNQQQFDRLIMTVGAWSKTQPNPKFAIDEFIRMLQVWRARL